MSDLIRRADAIEAVENNSYGMGSRASVEAIKALPSAEASQNLAEPNKELKGSDLIRREDAIDAVFDTEPFVMMDGKHLNRSTVFQKTSDVIDALSALPSAEAVQGEWVDDGCIEKCNQCGERRGFPHWKFCPNCGARMTKGGDSE